MSLVFLSLGVCGRIPFNYSTERTLKQKVGKILKEGPTCTKATGLGCSLSSGPLQDLTVAGSWHEMDRVLARRLQRGVRSQVTTPQMVGEFLSFISSVLQPSASIVSQIAPYLAQTLLGSF